MYITISFIISFVVGYCVGRITRKRQIQNAGDNSVQIQVGNWKKED